MWLTWCIIFKTLIYLLTNHANERKVFLKTATTSICHLFWEDDSNEADSKDESEAMELNNNINNNQNDENLFKRLQVHIESFSIHSTPIQVSDIWW